MRRVNLDIRAPNENGKLLLQLCKSSSLRIANGRIAGDELGCFTRYPLHDNRDVDPSVIDYSLISENLLPEVQRFTVNKLTSLSDHCCISTRIKTDCFISLPAKNETDNVDMSPIPARFLWNPDSADNFTAALNEPAILDRLVSFQNSVFSNDQNGTDEAVNQLTNIILDVATTSISKSTKRFKGKRIKKNPQKKWLTKDCQVTKNKLSRLANKLRQCPFDHDLQQKYRALYFHYKTMIRKAAKTYNNDLKDKLLSIENNNPKMFWNMISKIKTEDNATDPIDGALVGLPQKAKKYIDYFTNLYSSPNNSTSEAASVFKSFLKDKYRDKDIMKYLNSPFQLEEVKNGINKLKSGKAPGIDNVINEFLKVGANILVKSITKLFNHLLCSQKFPKEWSTNTLSTIHKGGSRENLDNYRGISVGSCFGKLYGSLLSQRLEKTILEYEMIGSNQIGFLKGHRTTDHIFVVNTLINKIVKNKAATPQLCLVGLGTGSELETLLSDMWHVLKLVYLFGTFVATLPGHEKRRLLEI
eukprot:gene11381-12567_t